MTFVSTSNISAKVDQSVMNIWNGFYQVHEDEKHFRISLGVPGIKENMLRIQVEDNRRVLKVTGYRNVTTRQRGVAVADSVLFERRIFLGCKVSTRKLDASISKAVLYVKVTKKSKKSKKRKKRKQVREYIR